MSSSKAGSNGVDEALYAGVDTIGEPDPIEPESAGWLKHETELGAADYFTARYGQDLRFIHVNNVFQCWDGQRWNSDIDGAANRLVHKFVSELVNEAVQTPGEDRQKRIKFALGLETMRRQQAVLTLARDMKPIAARVDAFDCDPLLFNVQNGTIDLRTGKLGEHRREDMISKISPIAFDPAAKCPRWDAFLAEIFPGDADLVKYVQRAVGYSLTGESREHVIFIPLGSGSNGKSTFITTVSDILGDYAASTNAETFVGRKDNAATNDLARLHNARFVSAVEAGENKSLSEAFVKSVTGGDPITARFLFREFFEFVAIFKLWLATNHRPTIRGADDGIWRRIKLIPFTARFPEDDRDVKLDEKLRSEYPGILAWAVRGARAYLRDGLGNCKAVDEATAGYRSDMDLLGSFIEQCCTEAAGASATTAELVAAYNAWAEKNGEKPITGRALALALQNRGFKKNENRRTARGFLGLKLGSPTLNGDGCDACEPFSPTSLYARAGRKIGKNASQASHPSHNDEIDGDDFSAPDQSDATGSAGAALPKRSERKACGFPVGPSDSKFCQRCGVLTAAHF
jgi:putative DNA primase/helicase